MKFEAGEVDEKVVAVSVLVLVVGFLVEVFAAVVNIDVIKVMGLIPIVVVEMVGFVVLLFIVVVFGGAVLAVVVVVVVVAQVKDEMDDDEDEGCESVCDVVW